MSLFAWAISLDPSFQYKIIWKALNKCMGATEERDCAHPLHLKTGTNSEHATNQGKKSANILLSITYTIITFYIHPNIWPT